MSGRRDGEVNAAWFGSVLLEVAAEAAAVIAGVPVETARAQMFELVGEEEAGARAAADLLLVVAPTVLRQVDLARARARVRLGGGWRARVDTAAAAWRASRAATSVGGHVKAVLDREVVDLLAVFAARLSQPGSAGPL